MGLPDVAAMWLGRLPPLPKAASGHWEAAKGALAVLLLLGALRLLLWLLRFVWAYFLRPGLDPRSYGQWAVVTGATDGIGKAYSRLLAQRGEHARLGHALGAVTEQAVP